MDNTKRIITTIIENICQSKGITIKADPELSLRSDIGFTSLDMLELIGEIEEKTDIFIRESELSSIETVGEIIAFTESKLRR